MQPSSFNMPNQPGNIPPVPPAAPVANGVPSVPPPTLPTSSWVAATDQDAPGGTPTSQAAPAPAPAPNDMPALADDGDLIEKEWVAKVKQIVQSTANDPYERNKQFTHLRTEYMQKRYGKQIKTED